MEPDHIHHRFYKDELSDFNERLHTSILGLPESPLPFPNIRARFEPYIGWLDHPEVLLLHFEAFITNRDQVIDQVYNHAIKRGFPTTLERERALQILAESIDPQRSPTFRSGKTGGWKSGFSEKNRGLFKEVAGDLLIRLGYEQNHDW